jgi:hypothetical protein
MADTLGTLKTAYDLAKDLVNLHDATVRQGKVAELQRQILDAQQSAIDANQVGRRLSQGGGERGLMAREENPRGRSPAGAAAYAAVRLLSNGIEGTPLQLRGLFKQFLDEVAPRD